MFRQGGCKKCSGALFPDGDEWRCFVCGACYYPHRPEAIVRRARREESLNSRISSEGRKLERWWEKHTSIVELFKQDHTIRQVSVMTGKPDRFLRRIREEWKELEPTYG